jgi:hypothetical protein
LTNKDWDNVVILDGCRYDLFRETNTIDGKLDSRITPVSATPEFLTENFQDRQFHDIVYVTANPTYRTRELHDVFYRVIDVWKDQWDDDLKTVKPEAMAEATKQVHARHPNKRIISHFMQPHYPFIGDLSAEIGQHSGFEYIYRRVTGKEASRDNPTVWECLKYDDLSRELVWNAYRENLEIALPHVQELVDMLDGKTVITSDHGNMLGERPFPLASRIYGHPKKVRCEQLCQVPWLICEYNTRKKITEDDQSRSAELEKSEIVTDRLADLGYVDAQSMT